MTEKKVDVLIVGGGLIGAIFMLALAPLGIRCLLVDTQSLSERVDGDFDARSLALSSASIRIMKMLGLWRMIEPYTAAIDSIHVSEQGRFGTVCLDAEALNSLGCVVEIQHLHQALASVLDHNTIIAPARVTAYDKAQGVATITTATDAITVKAKLVVAADGADSCMRRFCGLNAEVKQYPYQALIANIGISRSHKQVAYERFTATGPLALLPMTGLSMSLVWSLTPERAEQLLHADHQVFLNELQKAFGYRLGRLIKVGQRVIYPLRRVIMPQCTTDSVVFIGNAANTLHPVAGQGFNLGLRDVAMLAQSIQRHGLVPVALSDYQRLRRHDHAAITRLTDGLAELFTKQQLGIPLARSIGLMVLDNSRLLKQLLARYARGFAGVVPDLVCGLSLGSYDAREPNVKS